MKSFWTRFVEWQYYVHYLLLALIVLSFQQWIFKGWLIFVVLKLSLVLFVGDSIVHAFFWVLPKGKGQWRD